nr:hypothetical protein [Tanacetum cinerariifolium]
MSQPGDVSSNRNPKQPINNESIFQNCQGNTYEQAGGAFPNATVQGLNTTGERLRAAVLSLEGPALSWLSRAFSQLGGAQKMPVTPFSILTRRMAAQLPGLSEEVFEGILLRG